ncbi:MAG: AmmeMemoRadiSam system protein B [Candidatus Ratteibacteria bacterium]|nr:AmmeMemoRadiSam system protein B [Candidatus Ratteibacteria bacterium]
MKKTINIIVVLILVFLAAVYADSQEMRIRKPAVAGKFYADEKIKLSNEVEKYLTQVPKLKVPGEVVAIVVPHAGYIFSAPVAAYAYKVIEDSPRKTVILIGPSHHFRFDGISVFPRGIYETPLGQVAIDEELASDFIGSSDKVQYHQLAHYSEHSLEVQLPFLQKIWGNKFKIVPLLLGSHSWEIIETLKRMILDNLPGEPFILVASSDMSHYHNYEEAVAIDKESLRLVKNFDVQGLYAKIESGRCEWCGAGALLAVMEIAGELGADKVKILKYANSNDTAPPWQRNKEQVVGYSAIVFYREGKAEKKKKEEKKLLDREEQEKLLKIARVSIENALRKKDPPGFTDISDNLKKLGGVFVTLNKQGRLRGCIGFPEAVLPLYQAVSQAAVSAALKDYRFPTVTQKELSDIEIEISALSPLEKISDVEKVEVGRHGLVIRKGIYSGLLLPQVPVEYGWDRAEFLERICEKAGLPRGAWRGNVELYIFTAQVFHEKKQ